MGRRQRPLIYACSGCSDVAQLANNVAVRLDHDGEFEMSCRSITALDGCPLHCVRACLENIGVTPDEHVRLYDFGFKKHYGQSYGEDAIEKVRQAVLERRDSRIPAHNEDTDAMGTR